MAARLLARGLATPERLRTTLSLEDVLDINESLDWHDALENAPELGSKS